MGEAKQLFTFNDFKFNASEEIIHKSILEDEKNTKKSIETFLGSTINVTTKAKNVFEKIETGAMIGEIGMVVYSLIAGNLNAFGTVGLIINPALIVSSLGSMIETKKVVDYKKENIDMMYKTYLGLTDNGYENGKAFNLTDEMIHDMTFCLNDGEYEDNYTYLSEFGKCPVVMGYQIDPNGFEYVWNFPTKDANVSRVFEIGMHICMLAYPGYEDDIRRLYLDILEYYHAVLSNDKENIKAMIDVLSSYEGIIGKRGR